MTVDRLQTIAVVDHNAVAIDPERCSPHDAAIIRRLNSYVLRDGEIVAEMHLLIDLLTVVDIAAYVSEGGFGLCVRLAREGLRPEEAFGAFEAKVGQRLVVRLAHLRIDLDEARNRIARAVRIEFTEDLLQELIGYLDLVLRINGLFLLGEDHGEWCRHIVACSIGGVDQRRRARRHVPGESEQREEARLAAGHRPGTECLVPNADARGGVGASDVEGSKIGHAEVKVMLVGVCADKRWLRDHVHIALNASGSMKQAAGRGFEDEMGWSIMQLGRGLNTDFEVEGAFRTL